MKSGAWFPIILISDDDDIGKQRVVFRLFVLKSSSMAQPPWGSELPDDDKRG
jgi:hypothetical protein